MIMKNFLILLFLFTLLMAGCNKDPFRVDITDIRADISISRFEKDLFSADPSKLEENIPVWKKEYGIFFQHFSYILKLGPVDDPGFADRLRQFVTDRTNFTVYEKTLQIFPDMESFEKDISLAFRHYRYYFSDKPIPRIVTYISGFNQSAITDDSLLAVGLDKYLGSGEEIYRKIGVYNYLLTNMHPGKMVSDCILFWGETEFPYNDSINNLLTNMLYRGRLLYFTSAMIPGEPDTLKWGFTERNLGFCKANEKSMWAYLVEKKLLFSTDRFTIDKFILEGPFTSDFGRESPGRAAVWLGYRIVSDYMSKNSDVTLQDLMEERDYMRILNLSAYNP
jgi:hypothetical protein